MFSLDGRGGHNRYKFNKDFFKIWTKEMAYVLGFMYADGNIVDSIISRAKYISFDSVDLEIIEKIRDTLSSNHKVQIKPGKLTSHINGVYKSKDGFRLRIGSKEMFEDLMKLGITPQKSLTIRFPQEIPKSYLGHFARGYFDGDGCVHIMKGRSKLGKQTFKGLTVIFTSGSRLFLEELRNRFEEMGLVRGRIYFGSNSYQLKYSTLESMLWFQIFYGDEASNLFLKRKLDIFIKYLQNRARKNHESVVKILQMHGAVAKTAMQGTANPLCVGANLTGASRVIKYLR